MGSSPGPTGIRLLRAPEESPRLEWVGKGGVEPPRPFGHTDLNRARLPFRHLPWRATTVAAGPPDTAAGAAAGGPIHAPCGASQVPGRYPAFGPATITVGTAGRP